MGSVSLSKGRGKERDRVDGLSLAQLYTSRQTDKANPENGREGGERRGSKQASLGWISRANLLEMRRATHRERQSAQAHKRELEGKALGLAKLQGHMPHLKANQRGCRAGNREPFS